jgi:hypothetical protein
LALYDFWAAVLYVPKNLARGFSLSSTFLQSRLKKEVTACVSANSKYRWARPNLHGETMMNRLCRILTSFTARCALLCGFSLASLLPLYAQQSTEQSMNSAAANTPTDPTTDSDVPAAPNPQFPPNSVAIPTTLTFGERLRIYEHSFVTPEALIGPALGAAVGQADNTPPEWGQGAAGYGTRLGSAYGRSVIARTIALGVATADREDSRFQPSNETGVWRRTKHAVIGTFVSRTASGGSMPAISRFVGVYSAAFIANAWEPPSQDGSTKAWERGSTALASSVAWHVFEEFWPDIRNALHLHHHHDEP